MDLTVVVDLVVDIVNFCLPFTLAFALTAKCINFAIDMMFNRKIDL